MEESAEEPKKFSWVEEDMLAAMEYPQTAGNMKYLKEQGKQSLLTFKTSLKMSRSTMMKTRLNLLNKSSIRLILKIME